MVLDPPRKEVEVWLMVVLSFIPIAGIYAAWRIQKFWLILLLELGISVVFGVVVIPLALFLPELAMFVGIAVGIGVNVILVKYFAEKYNEKVSRTQRTSQNNEKITDYVEHDTDIQNKSQTSKNSGMVPVDKWNEKDSED